MANIPHLTLAQPRAAEAGRSEESKHCPALRDGGKENKGKEETFFQVGLETYQFSKPKYVYTLTLKSDKHSILSNM